MRKRIFCGGGYSPRRSKQWFSLLLCLCLIGTTVPVTARAEESGSMAAGLCEHHPQHTAECGYEAPVGAHECGHEHTDECYTQGDCRHEHTADCYADSALPEEGEDKAADQCEHEHTVESGCLVLDCPHENGEHDDTCGYVESTGGSPCTFACDTCGDAAGPEEQEPAGNNLSAAALAVQELIDALPAAENITEENFEDVADQLAEIDTAREALTDEENGEITYTKYDAAVAKMMELMGQAGAEEAATMSLVGFSSNGRPAGATAKTICLDLTTLRPASTWSTGGNLVYFGNYNGRTTAYRVLASPNTQIVTNSLLLDCNTTLKEMKFDADGTKNDGQVTNSNEWKGSDLETWLNGNAFSKTILYSQKLRKQL